MKKLIFITTILLVSINPLIAQNETDKKVEQLANDIDSLKDISKPGVSKFLLRGYGHAGLEITDDESSFVGGSFNPIFIYKQSDKLLFESELEFGLEDGELEIGLEYANISYLLTKSVTVRFGKMLLPFGIYVDRMHPAWIDKLASKPLGVGHGGILPGSDIGIELRGGAYLGSSKINYAFYLVNGPYLNEGDDEPEEAGQLHYNNFPDNNNNKTVGGRLGFLPLSNSSLELGASGMYGKVGSRDSEYSDVAALLYAVDLSYIQNLPFMSSVLDVKAQYSGVNVGNANYVDTEDTVNVGATYTFDNQSTTYFVQLALRPAMVDNNFFRNIELVGRYSELNTPEGALWDTKLNQWEIGLNYWLDWRTVFKFTYRITQGEAGHDEGGESPVGNAFLFHWAIGF
ncbi:MAG: hypothetical protein DRI95_08650 [Bacteroidetes bacterium]|nr:MAG: hypothetical protein DRI95_08650 [Bacteroidota bacterium]